MPGFNTQLSRSWQTFFKKCCLLSNLNLSKSRNSTAMHFSKKVNLIIYRFREKGLEIFLINSEDGKNWQIPTGPMNQDKPRSLLGEDRLIELDPVSQEDGKKEEALAVEGEWHDIPSLKAMMHEDARFLKEKLEEMEKGTYLTIKEALKKVLPHQYAFLKELKDILSDRNSLKDL